MNNSKPFKFHSIDLSADALLAKVARKSAAISNGVEPFGSTGSASPLGPTGPDSIRYAKTIDGMLCQRDPDDLLRYLNAAQGEQERERRQNQLFERASVRLACLPNGVNYEHLEVSSEQSRLNSSNAGQEEEFLETGIVITGLIAFPIVLTFSENQNVIRRLALDNAKQLHVVQEIENALAHFSSTPLAGVRVESIIAVDDLNGITPLQVQTAMVRETRKMSGEFEPTAVEIPQDMLNPRFDLIRRHQAGWSLNLPQRQEFALPVGGSRAVAYLVIAFFSWDRDIPAPLLDDPWMLGERRLQSLLEGYFAQDSCSSAGEAGRNASPNRTTVSVGQPAFIQTALTNAQKMLYEKIASTAHEKGDSFELKVESRASVLHWQATVNSNVTQPNASTLGEKNEAPIVPSLMSGDHEVLAVVEHIYDSTWRPQSHIDEVKQGVLKSSSQGKSQIPEFADGTSKPVQLDLQFGSGEKLNTIPTARSFHSDDDESGEGNSRDASNGSTLH
jgi:hypothetical protein